MQTLLGKLYAKYSEPHRFYHTWNHIGSMLEESKRFLLSEEQVLAVYLHDVIYDPKSSENEENSASFAEGLLSELRFDPEKIKTVKQIIIDTKKHIPTIEDSALVLDLDMAILAAPKLLFNNYCHQIALEYQGWLGAEVYSSLRLKFLTKLLGQEKIFHTKEFSQKEILARMNLEEEIRSLSNG